MKITYSMVLFWRTDEVFSNWHPAFFFDGKGRRFANSEQYMMWAKAFLMGDLESADLMFQHRDPRVLKDLGRQVRNYREDLWEQHRLAVMVCGCFFKFSQNPAMAAQLMASGDLELVEASPYDCIWGIGLEESDPRCQDKMQWRGRNLLGEALMIVRDLLARKAALPEHYMAWGAR